MGTGKPITPPRGGTGQNPAPAAKKPGPKKE